MVAWGQPEPVSGQTNPREERPAIYAAGLLYQSRPHCPHSQFATGVDFAFSFHVLVALLGIMTILVSPP